MPFTGVQLLHTPVTVPPGVVSQAAVAGMLLANSELLKKVPTSIVQPTFTGSLLDLGTREQNKK